MLSEIKFLQSLLSILVNLLSVLDRLANKKTTDQSDSKKRLPVQFFKTLTRKWKATFDPKLSKSEKSYLKYLLRSPHNSYTKQQLKGAKWFMRYSKNDHQVCFTIMDKVTHWVLERLLDLMIVMVAGGVVLGWWCSNALGLLHDHTLSFYGGSIIYLGLIGIALYIQKDYYSACRVIRIMENDQIDGRVWK